LDIALLQRRTVELAWFAFAVANVVAMVIWEHWETIPFHFIWVSLTLVYGFRIWPMPATAVVLGAVCTGTGILITLDARAGSQTWGELTEVPLMSAMFLAMVWHARRRQQALKAVERLADERASLLTRQQRFVHDASHELRTPVTIARGHLELLPEQPAEATIALDELNRIERIIDRLLLLATSDQPDFVVPEPIDVESFLEDVFLRWAESAPRSWRLGSLACGVPHADAEALREALDALLENAVKYTEPHAVIELSSHADGTDLVIDVRDAGRGIAEDAVGRIFERFARADAARSRAEGGVGLGLAIVDAIAKAHSGSCTVHTSTAGSTFSLAFPDFAPQVADVLLAPTASPTGAREAMAIGDIPGAPDRS
jgi:signal transduction histidine kinase